MKHPMTLCAAALLGLSQLAVAEPPAMLGGPGHPGKEMLFEFLDTNADGKITSDEFAAGETERFKIFDANGDGKISAEEFASGHERMRARLEAIHFQRLDTDKDGTLSADEFAVPTEKLFDRADRNGDGVVTQGEIKRRHGGPGKGGKR